VLRNAIIATEDASFNQHFGLSASRILVTLFKDLRISRGDLDREMQSAMRNSFGPEWSPIFRVRSQTTQQAYMYIREDGKNVRVALLTVDKEQAAIIRATFSPEKLVEFINDPKIMGISLSDEDNRDGGN
jgi:hypothetical protein